MSPPPPIAVAISIRKQNWQTDKNRLSFLWGSFQRFLGDWVPHGDCVKTPSAREFMCIGADKNTIMTSKSQNPIMKINFAYTPTARSGGTESGGVSRSPWSNLRQLARMRGADRQALPCLKYFWHLQNSYWQLCQWHGGGAGNFTFEFEELLARMRGQPGGWTSYAACVGIREIFDSYFNEIMQAHFHTFRQPLESRALACRWAGRRPGKRKQGQNGVIPLGMWVNHMHFGVCRRPVLCHTAFWLFN